MTSDEERKKRLAEALRENLRRRKAQARGVKGGDQSQRDSPGRVRDPSGEET
jgi:hypothetical protein